MQWHLAKRRLFTAAFLFCPYFSGNLIPNKGKKWLVPVIWQETAEPFLSEMQDEKKMRGDKPPFGYIRMAAFVF